MKLPQDGRDVLTPPSNKACCGVLHSPQCRHEEGCQKTEQHYHRRLAGTQLYCLSIQTHVCENQGCGVKSEFSFWGRLRLLVTFFQSIWLLLYLPSSWLLLNFSYYENFACTLLYAAVHLILEEFRFSFHSSWNTQSAYHLSLIHISEPTRPY